MRIEWVDGFEIRVSIQNREAVISANREGLLSLAEQLTALAGEAPGTHIHYDPYNSLEDGSAELIIVKTGHRTEVKEMTKMIRDNFIAMPHTEIAFPDPDSIRVWKTGSLEPDINTYAAVRGSDFHNGTIEVDVCGRLLPDAPDYARGFIGIAFRAAEDGREFESFYIRPTNGKHCNDPVRKEHGCQYFSFPGYTFSYLRQFGITEYENRADTIALNEWSHIRAVIKEEAGVFFVDGVKVLEVHDLKHGPHARGNVGLYVDIGTDALFRNLSILFDD